MVTLPKQDKCKAALSLTDLTPAYKMSLPFIRTIFFLFYLQVPLALRISRNLRSVNGIFGSGNFTPKPVPGGNVPSNPQTGSGLSENQQHKN